MMTYRPSNFTTRPSQSSLTENVAPGYLKPASSSLARAFDREAQLRASARMMA
jgi:hypothetical protein